MEPARELVPMTSSYGNGGHQTYNLQVKYTNPSDPQGLLIVLPSPRGADDHRQRGLSGGRAGKYAFGSEARHRSNQPGVVIDQPSSSRKAVGHKTVYLLLDQIKREKGVWWMPWQ